MKQLCELRPEMGPQVLDHLRQFVDFDELNADLTAGACIYIAGQAVASALSELFGDGAGVVYNDVDAFVLNGNAKPHLRGMTQELSQLTLDHARIYIDDYGHMNVESEAAYYIQATSRKGLLNQVHGTAGWTLRQQKNPQFRAQTFTQSFDMNCVQVCVSLNDQRLYWTPAFADFWATKEMLVMSVKTPLHTAIRWFSKKAELEGVYGHDVKTMELLTAATQRVQVRRAELQGHWSDQRSYRQADAQLKFGIGYREKAERVLGELSPYFSLESVESKEVLSLQISTLLPTAEITGYAVDPALSALALPAYMRAKQGHWKRHVCNRVLSLMEQPEKNIWVENACRGQLLSALEHVKVETDLTRVSKFIRSHGRLAFVVMDLPAEEQLRTVKMLEKLEAELGPIALGALESMSIDSVRELYKDPGYMRYETVKAATLAEVERLTKLSAELVARPSVVEPIDLEGFRVTQLKSFEELVHEGHRMHHCVAGYFGEVHKGNKVILSFSKPRLAHSLTVELFKPEGYPGWIRGQAQGLQNRWADDRESKVIGLLVCAINLQALLAKAKVNLPLPWLLKVARAVPRASALLASQATGPRISKATLKQKLHNWAVTSRQGLKAKLFSAIGAVSWGPHTPVTLVQGRYLHEAPWRLLMGTAAYLRIAQVGATLGLIAPGTHAALAESLKADGLDDSIPF